MAGEREVYRIRKVLLILTGNYVPAEKNIPVTLISNTKPKNNAKKHEEKLSVKGIFEKLVKL